MSLYYFDIKFLFCSYLNAGIMRNKYYMSPYSTLILLTHILWYTWHHWLLWTAFVFNRRFYDMSVVKGSILKENPRTEAICTRSGNRILGTDCNDADRASCLHSDTAVGAGTKRLKHFEPYSYWELRSTDDISVLMSRINSVLPAKFSRRLGTVHPACTSKNVSFG
jgi:hypothetical protein